LYFVLSLSLFKHKNQKKKKKKKRRKKKTDKKKIGLKKKKKSFKEAKVAQIVFGPLLVFGLCGIVLNPGPFQLIVGSYFGP
jgi:hypothetical protein